MVTYVNFDTINALFFQWETSLKYISIDGDDVGRKITSCYLNNDEDKLHSVSKQLEESTKKIADLLLSRGFDVIFSAADGVVARTESDCNFEEIFLCICSCSSIGITFSAGVGTSLREAYIALLNSKSNGKNQLSHFDTLK
ncbi:mCpol domain-containing protein [Microbulbifer sp. ZKSA004]|uniref:mCpol domain-containing protein n=1 Tax=Microbulbifer sp. ZKSA004 TaxID=3243389 RepID=UPI0040393E84